MNADPYLSEGSSTMSMSVTSPSPAADQGSIDADTDGFQLDVRIVETGPAAAALLGGTDDGCNTVRGSDC